MAKERARPKGFLVKRRIHFNCPSHYKIKHALSMEFIALFQIKVPN